MVDINALFDLIPFSTATLPADVGVMVYKAVSLLKEIAHTVSRKLLHDIII